MTRCSPGPLLGWLFDRRRMTNMTCNEFDTALATEWAVISTGNAARRTVERWAEVEPVFDPFDTPHDVLIAIGAEDLDESIAITQAVVRLAATEQLASRLLLQVMVPTLATECFRTLRTLRAERVPVSSTEVVALVIGAAAETIGCFAKRTSLPFPIRTIRRRTIQRVVDRRTRMIERASVEVVELIDGEGKAGCEPELEQTAAELLADTLVNAVHLGIVSSDDAELVWMWRRHDMSARTLARGDAREHSRLRKRRGCAQLRLIENREALVEAEMAG